MKCYYSIMFFMILSIIVFEPTYSQTYFTRITNAGSLNSSAYGSYSSSWGDINNDDYPDLLVIKNPTLQLHINNGDGTFSAVNSGHLVETDFYQNSAVFGDYNNDGNLDLYISNLGPNTPIPTGDSLYPQINFLYKNSGSPDYTLELIRGNGLDTDSSMTWTSSWVDYDNDGDIDILVPGDQGDKDMFFINNGDGTFSENENLSFLNPGEFSAAGGWTDFDNDGDKDLLIVNYQGVNNELYQNELIESGIATFTQINSQPIVQDQDYDLAPSFGDYDNDGDMDVFIGTWIGRKNLLFKNNGNFTFQKILSGPVVEQTWTLGYTWLDFDNDGYLDLFVANSQGEDNTLYQNNGNGTFTKVSQSAAGNILSSWGNTYSVSVADYDNDGDIDIYIPGSQAALFRNDIGSNNNWVNIKCKGVQSNSIGIGTVIRLKAEISSGNFVWQMREIHGGPTGDRAQNNQRAHFGLGTASIIDSLVIEWPSGIKDLYTNLNVNQFFNAIEGANPLSVKNSGAGTPDNFILQNNYPNPFNPSTIIKYSIASESFVTLAVFNSLGEKISALVQENKPAGQYSVNFNASKLPSGVYFYQLKANNFLETKKMILTK